MAKVISLEIEMPEDAAPGYLRKALDELVKACQKAGVDNGWPEFEMAESPWEIELKKYGGLSLELNDCGEGRLFGEAAELRWRRRRNHVDAVLIADRDISIKLDGFEGVNSMDKNEPRDTHLVLWGEEKDAGGAWGEDRIPRALDYPAAGDGQPCLLVREYLDGRGVAEFSRFVTVEVKPLGKAKVEAVELQP